MRVLVLGTSHAATIKRAFPAIAAEYPNVTLGFWGLPGAAFAKAKAGPDGLLRPDPDDAIGLRKATDWNGAEFVDLAAWDRIFLVGLRYGMRPAHQIMRALQPYEWGPRAGTTRVSLGLLRAAIRAEVEASVRAQDARTPFDGRVTALPAPYPATVVLAPGAMHQPATKAVASLTHAADLMEMFEAEVRAAHAARGIGLVLQPRDTVAQPWLSVPDHLEEPDRDGRHMNARYGLIAFRALMAGAAPINAATSAAHPQSA